MFYIYVILSVILYVVLNSILNAKINGTLNNVKSQSNGLESFKALELDLLDLSLTIVVTI